MLRLRGANRGAQILPLILLQRLVERGDDGVAIEDAAEMLHCAPAQVVQRLSRLLEKAPDHHMLLGFLPGRISLTGGILIDNGPRNIRSKYDWALHEQRLKRGVAWKQVRKLPAPPKTFTLPEAAKALNLSRKQTEKLLADWLSAPYIGMFMLKERPLFFARLF